MIRVAVAGVLGRMGTLARAVVESANGMTFAGGFARASTPAVRVYDRLDELFAREKPDVLVDFTTHPTTVEVAAATVSAGVRPVIGSSGWTDDERSALARAVDEHGSGALLVPNFALGAVLMMRFAALAARYFPTAAIVELHHDKKRDAPSGTARLTRERIVAHGGPAEVAIQSVRLRGLVAHQEVLFGGDGELLTIRHDSLSRESFAAGIQMAIRAVGDVRGLVVGLDDVVGPSTPFTLSEPKGSG